MMNEKKLLTSYGIIVDGGEYYWLLILLFDYGKEIVYAQCSVRMIMGGG